MYAAGWRKIASDLVAYVINPRASTMFEWKTNAGSLRFRASSAICLRWISAFEIYCRRAEESRLLEPPL